MERKGKICQIFSLSNCLVLWQIWVYSGKRIQEISRKGLTQGINLVTNFAKPSTCVFVRQSLFGGHIKNVGGLAKRSVQDLFVIFHTCSAAKDASALPHWGSSAQHFEGLQKIFQEWRKICRHLSIRAKCDGCKGAERTACMYICPNDLMILIAAGRMKAYNQEPDACWECYSCVKSVPRAPLRRAPMPTSAPWAASVPPMRSGDSIQWTVKFRNGAIKRFQFPIRTTPEGSIKPWRRQTRRRQPLITNACLPKRSWQNPRPFSARSSRWKIRA